MEQAGKTSDEVEERILRSLEREKQRLNHYDRSIEEAEGHVRDLRRQRSNLAASIGRMDEQLLTVRAVRRVAELELEVLELQDKLKDRTPD